ncbi:MAG: hypothetical protein HY898_20690 [Deltaproteobacteria bacterium]|nr:hypothetical protein [Deltaproteobacteria bacterium]
MHIEVSRYRRSSSSGAARSLSVRALVALLALLAFGVLGCRPKVEETKPAPKPERDVEYYLTALKGSVHAGIDCAKCHLEPVDKDSSKGSGQKRVCDRCHEEQAKLHAESVHGKSLARGETGAAQCWDCHGSHSIVKVTDPASPAFKLRLPYTCATCHRNKELAKQHGIRQPEAGSQYIESTHGRALLLDGLVVAPACNDCHGQGHSIQDSKDPRSPINHANVPKTCGRCHVGIEETFKRSKHFQLLKAGDPRGPVCVDCHSAHKIQALSAGNMKLHSDERCGRCHQDKLARYRETYHGRAIALGQSSVAACYDCHGHHDILPASDPASTLAKGRVVETCRKCHADANANFAGYLTHGDHSDRKSYPILYWVYVFMTSLMLGTGGFFALHTMLWFVRSIALYRRDPKYWREWKKRMRQEKEGKIYVRFRPIDRFLHFLMLSSFLLLATTGMPLKFYYADWAQWMFSWMGGAAMAGGLHRLGAFMTVGYFSIHIATLLGTVWRQMPDLKVDGRFSIRKFLAFCFGPDSPMPNFQDLRDFWAHQKWFFGKGKQPDFDRWTYWEKFDYLAVFWGVPVIGLSGLVMWIPQLVTRVFPGWVINVAHIIHSDEALLATGFIFTFHFFNVHFRAEKFPMDPVIFSGRITEEEMMHERRRQYDRLKASGKLDEAKVGDEWGRWKKIFTPIGMMAFGIGVALIIAIYWVMARRLMHG